MSVANPPAGVCISCGKPATVMQLLNSAKRAYDRDLAVWQAKHVKEGFSVIDVSDLSEHPDLIAWRIVCDAHVFEDGGLYWFPYPKTWQSWLDWTAHLLEKEWLVSTNWSDVLRKLVA